MRPLSLSGTVWPGRGVRVTPRAPPAGTPPRLLPAASGSAGYLSIIPLQRSDGSWILLAKGWYPASLKEDADSVPGSASPVQVQALGVLRLSEKPGQWAVKVMDW